MLDITIVTIGKTKEKYFAEAAAEYVKRLKPYAVLKLEELKPEKFSEHNETQARQAETLRILSFLEKRKDSSIFILDEFGREYGSVEFSEHLGSLEVINAGKVVFVVAGSLGYDREIIPLSIPRFSLSKMTFPHELAKVLLLEQIYRGISIKKAKKYHH